MLVLSICAGSKSVEKTRGLGSVVLRVLHVENVNVLLRGGRTQRWPSGASLVIGGTLTVGGGGSGPPLFPFLLVCEAR